MSVGSSGTLHLEIKDGYTRSNFCKNLLFSPDGSSFVTSTENGNLYQYTESDNTTKDVNIITDINTIATVTASKYEYNRLEYRRSEPIYDIKWYPYMNRTDPSTNCFISCSKDHPIHLWDANGSLRCTYNGHNHLDELDSPTSLSFNLTGDKIYAGSERMIRCFDVANPTKYSSHPTSSSRKDKNGQKGLISCIEFNPDYSGSYAAGSYSNSVFIYVENTKGSALDITDLPFGVSCIKWSKCGNYLFIGGRRSNSILCWDVRMSLVEVGRVERQCESSQKMTFDVDPSGKCLWTGTQDGRLLKYDVTTLALVGSLQGLPDCVSAVHCHPQRPATVGLCTGQRHFDLLESDTERESDINDSDSDSDKMDEIVHELYGQNNNTQNENEIINKQNQFSAVQIWSF